MALALGTALAALPATAQATAERVDAFKAWSVFKADDGGPVCWIVSQPESTKAARGGKPVKVRRGDIYMMVAVRPNQGVKNETSVMAGYPFRNSSGARLEVGGKRFDLFTKDESAWPSPEDDDALIEAFRKGSVAVVTGVSSRGTTTTDRYSLLGFSAALDSAKGRCQ